MANIRPLDDRIVVQVLDAEAKTSGGIILPDAAKEKPQRGKVTAIGDGARNKDGSRAKLTVKKGDTVIFGKYAGTDFEIRGKDYKIMRENEVLARVD